MIRINVDGSVRCAVHDLNPRGNRTILFVHGWPLSSRIFECQQVVLPEYGIRCVSVDLRGFGDSDQPWRGYTYDRMADDLCKVIVDMDLRNITLCGFSMGGAVCVRYMARHRGLRVSKLALMGAACPSFVQRPGFPYGMTKEAVDALIVKAYNDRPQTVWDFGAQCFYGPVSPQYHSWIKNLCMDGAGWATIKCAESLRDEDLRQDLGRIKVPTAILHGTQDKVCPFEFAEQMHKGIADSFVVPFTQSGHFLFYEERNKCNASLLDFISSAC